jgi:integrase
MACARAFFIDQLGMVPWRLFSQVRTRDADSLPKALSRQQVRDLLKAVRLRRYRIPLKLIYVCGLRLSECLSLTVHDIHGSEGKLVIRQGKGNSDRIAPLPGEMLEDLRRYWKLHRHPLLLFPNAGRGQMSDPARLAARMHAATSPMPIGSLQRLVVVARKAINVPDATVHALRHSYATHLLEAGVHLHAIQKLMGHRQINSTMVYLRMTYTSERNVQDVLKELGRDLPR